MNTHPSLLPIPKSDHAAWRALLAWEMAKYRGLHIGISFLWLCGLWIIPLIYHPSTFMGLGLVYTLIAAGNIGGSDINDGIEEFSFSQPLGRGPLFISRMLIGLVFITIISGIGSIAIAMNAPQLLWSLVFSSGLTEAFASIESTYWYWLSWCVPISFFSGTFSLAALSQSRSTLNFAWLGGLALSGSVIFVTSVAEQVLWKKVHGWLMCPLLLLVAVLTLLTGYRFYLEKEATRSGGTTGSRNKISRAITLLVLFLIVLFVLFILLKLMQVSSMN